MNGRAWCITIIMNLSPRATPLLRYVFPVVTCLDPLQLRARADEIPRGKPGRGPRSPSSCVLRDFSVVSRDYCGAPITNRTTSSAASYTRAYDIIVNWIVMFATARAYARILHSDTLCPHCYLFVLLSVRRLRMLGLG